MGEQTRVPHKPPVQNVSPAPAARLGATSQSPGPRRAHTPPVSPGRSVATSRLFPVASGPHVTGDSEDEPILPAAGSDATSVTAKELGPERARKVKENIHPLQDGWTCRLPTGWSTVKSEQTNKYYYYNEKEGKSRVYKKAPKSYETQYYDHNGQHQPRSMYLLDIKV